MWPFRGNKNRYVVTIFYDGRHPYLDNSSFEYPSFTKSYTLEAYGYDDAVKKARQFTPNQRFWSIKVKSIRPTDNPREWNIIS